MAIRLRIKKGRRTFQCDIAGCRNRTTYLISKRDDVAAHPLHLCPECIRGLYALIEDKGPEVPTLAPDGGLSINGGAEAIEAMTDEVDTMDWGEMPEEKPAKPAKAEAKPNRAKKKGGTT